MPTPLEQEFETLKQTLNSVMPVAEKIRLLFEFQAKVNQKNYTLQQQIKLILLDFRAEQPDWLIYTCFSLLKEYPTLVGDYIPKLYTIRSTFARSLTEEDYLHILTWLIRKIPASVHATRLSSYHYQRSEQLKKRSDHTYDDSNQSKIASKQRFKTYLLQVEKIHHWFNDILAVTWPEDKLKLILKEMNACSATPEEQCANVLNLLWFFYKNKTPADIEAKISNQWLTLLRDFLMPEKPGSRGVRMKIFSDIAAWLEKGKLTYWQIQTIFIRVAETKKPDIHTQKIIQDFIASTEDNFSLTPSSVRYHAFMAFRKKHLEISQLISINKKTTEKYEKPPQAAQADQAESFEAEAQAYLFENTEAEELIIEDKTSTTASPAIKAQKDAVKTPRNAKVTQPSTAPVPATTSSVTTAPMTEKPAAKKSATTAAAITTSVTTTPTAKKPAAKKSAATVPTAKKAVAKKSAATVPTTTSSVTTAPTTEKPAAKKSAATAPTTKKSAAKKSAATAPTAKKSAAKTKPELSAFFPPSGSVNPSAEQLTPATPHDLIAIQTAVSQSVVAYLANFPSSTTTTEGALSDNSQSSAGFSQIFSRRGPLGQQRAETLRDDINTATKASDAWKYLETLFDGGGNWDAGSSLKPILLDHLLLQFGPLGKPVAYTNKDAVTYTLRAQTQVLATKGIIR